MRKYLWNVTRLGAATAAHLLFGQAALPPNSSHREVHFFVSNGLGRSQLCTVT
jgi:hypothetical protein